ncbi:MAG: glycoside hydrolase family 125 protein [Actinobacteria bacterium]|nr:glycoside hydrolase family 125 protein [Actinomycetota bacterium]
MRTQGRRTEEPMPGADIGVPVVVPAGVQHLLERFAAVAPAQRTQRVRRAVERLFTDALRRLDDATVFVLTGDIPAMWLRDSTWQLRPLLAAATDKETYEVCAAISRRQAAFVLIDPYANAFNAEPNGNCWHLDFADQSPWVFERKYELDSLTSFLDFALRLFRASGRIEHLDAQFVRAAQTALAVIETEQQHDVDSYIFHRNDVPAHDHLSHSGRGAPTAHTGMSWSGFRPSDDACTYGYLVPSNAHASVVLEELSQVPLDVPISDDLRQRSARLAHDIREGINNHGIREVDGNLIYAYEVDGFGNALHMDDANVPSLLSLPYLGWCDSSDAVYAATRAWILSPANPWFAQGAFASGVGSPHTPPRHVWPIGIAMAALTSDDSGAAQSALELLEHTDAGTGQMHESFHVDDPSAFTRPWFSWADMTYVHLALRAHGLAFD